MEPRFSRHAIQRWAERVSKGSMETARWELQSAYYRAVPVPKRYAERLAGVNTDCPSVKFLMTMEALLVIKGSAVVTVLPWGINQYMEVLVHLVMGAWTEDVVAARAA